MGKTFQKEGPRIPDGMKGPMGRIVDSLER